MYLNNKEEEIIGVFLGNLDHFESFEMLLKWDNGSQVKALFDTCFEDEDDDENDVEFEEYMSFMFKVISVVGEPPIEICDNYFLINYRNFPKEIIVDSKKIN